MVFKIDLLSVITKVFQKRFGAMILVGLVFLFGCSQDVNQRETPYSPTVELAPTSTAGLIDFSFDSPRPAIRSPVPPTLTTAPTIQPSRQSTVVPTASAIIEQRTYIVQPGDTLGEIAEFFEVDLQELARINELEDLDHVEVGQELTIP